MKSIAQIVCGFAALVVAAPAFAGSSEGWVYWADGGSDSIRRAHLDGSSMEILYSGVQGVVNPKDLALDATNGYVYWTMGPPHKIQRAPLEGKGTVETLVALGFSVQKIRLDVSGGSMFWTHAAAPAGKIYRGNLDGSDVQELLSLNAPTALALDPAAGKLYWGLSPGLACGNEAKIQKSDLDGTNVEDVITGLKVIRSLAVDSEAGVLYWAVVADLEPPVSEQCANEINRANLDGSGPVEFLIANISFGIDLDPGDGKMYWSTSTAMKRANLDGSDVEDVITIGINFPMGLALLINERISNPADLNEDGIVDGIDLAILLGAWGACPPRGGCDADLAPPRGGGGDGIVNGFDLALLLGSWS